MGILFPELTSRRIDEMVEAYKYHFVTGDQTEQALFEGVEDGLQRLNDKGVLLAVATGKSRRGLDRIFDEIDIKHHFVATRCGDETRSKPHPQMLIELLDYTAIAPTDSIMIGDTSYDMEMANNADMHGLGVSYGVHSTKKLLACRPVKVLDSFQAVVGWLLDGRLQKAYINQ